MGNFALYVVLANVCIVFASMRLLRRFVAEFCVFACDMCPFLWVVRLLQRGCLECCFWVLISPCLVCFDFHCDFLFPSFVGLGQFLVWSSEASQRTLKFWTGTVVHLGAGRYRKKTKIPRKS